MANISKIKTPDGTSYDIKAAILSMNEYGEVGRDDTPYLYRRSGGNAANVGNRELDAIVGGSIVWNQLFASQTSATRTEHGLTITVQNGYECIIDGTFTGTTSDLVDLIGNSNQNYSFIKDHVYIALAPKIPVTVGTTALNVMMGNTNVFNYLRSNGTCVAKALNTGDSYSFGRLEGVVNGAVFNNYKFSYNIIDLTATFGSTIADYIYTLEQATAGSGIAWLRSYGYLTEDYYDYTANKIESVSVARHIMKDSNDSVIGSYAINPITLRGIPKLNASNQLYYDGDRYEASGRVTRKYGFVILNGKQPIERTNWRPTENGVGWLYPYNLTHNKIFGSSEFPNMITNSVNVITYNTIYEGNKGIAIFSGSSYGLALWINDTSLTTETAINNYLSANPIAVVYELATPTTESTSPFEANQIVDTNGTEEYIDAGVEAGTRDVAIPVGHDTKYLDIVSSRDIELPPQPPTDGKYNLNLDVTNSTPSFEFETASQALTYTLGTSGNNVTLTPSSGSAQSITVPYATNAGKVNNHTVAKDVPSDAVFTDNNTTYTFAEGTTDGAFSVTPSGGTAQSVPVHGVLTSHQSVTDNNPTLSWGSKSKVATIGSTEINVTMPSNPASGKQDTITGAATTVTSSNLTASRVLISNTSGKISAASGVTTTEVGYLAGLDRNVMGFYSHKSYDYDISNDNMRGISGQYEKNGSYWIKVEDWLGTMPPSGSYGTLEVMGNLQRFTVYGLNGSSTVYTRTYANSTWSDWKRIGSGVDASVSGTTLTLSSV